LGRRIKGGSAKFVRRRGGGSVLGVMLLDIVAK
jgi:hypothetical protein